MGYADTNQTVKEVGDLKFFGNIIPNIWFKTVTKNNRPNLLAISLLAEIVYWYRPIEEIDETTGETIGYQKKFAGDMLQKSYDELAKNYNVSKRQITDAIIFLEDISVIKRVFRTVEYANGVKSNNVLFIDLNVDTLRRLTYPDVADASEPECESNQNPAEQVAENPVTKNRETYHEKSGEVSPKNVTPITKNRETNTENTTKINNIIYYNHIISHPSIRDETERMFKQQIDYVYLCDEYETSSIEMGVVDACVDISCEILASQGKYIFISGAKRSLESVKSALYKLTIHDIESIVKNLTDIGHEIKNPKKYLLASLINAPTANKLKVANDFFRFDGGLPVLPDRETGRRTGT